MRSYSNHTSQSGVVQNLAFWVGAKSLYLGKNVREQNSLDIRLHPTALQRGQQNPFKAREQDEEELQVDNSIKCESQAYLLYKI